MTKQRKSKKAFIAVENLFKRYGKLEAVKGVSFEVNENEVFGILGPNGAGKTTTLEMIEGLQKIDDGTVRIGNVQVNKSPESVKEIIGVQLQSSEYFDNLNLEEILELFGKFYRRRIEGEDLLEKVQLSHKRKSKVKELSGGQKQRLSIASALVNDPNVIFLDEPTTGLDPQARRHLWEVIREIRDQDKKTVVLTTHYMEEAEELCDRIAIMDEGEIVALDTPENLINDLLGRGFKKEVKAHGANLEDVFIDLTGKKLRD